MKTEAEEAANGDREASSASSPAGLRAVADEVVFARVHKAIIEHRLEPGTKLGEEALCDVFGVSRAQVRRVLLNLAHKKVVELRRNRGAYVAQPTVREARHVFEARRAIEPAIVARAVARLTDDRIVQLEAIVAADLEAQQRGNRQAAIKQSGDFHLYLAEIAGNQVLHEFLQELVSRTSLIIATYGLTGDSGCSVEEHTELISALKSRDATRAIAIMRDHLDHLERLVKLTSEEAPAVDLRSILGEMVE